MVISAGLRAFLANMAVRACATRGFDDAPINEMEMGVASWPLVEYIIGLQHGIEQMIKRRLLFLGKIANFL